jgi:tRNA(Arg) A34 adenosine deaminase TadA
MKISVNDEKIKDSGLKELEKICLENKWKNWLLSYEFNSVYPDDKYVWLTNVLALKGVDWDNFGIGSILVDPNGDVIFQGHNEVFNPYFRSDRHAEMIVMNEFESVNRDISRLPQGYILYTSFEPCPMCTIRLITSRINKVLYAADDIVTGMVRKMKNLPELWIDLSEGKVFSQASCSQELIYAANEIFQLNADELIEKIKKIH